MLREAGAVFAERGFHAASMDEIADRVGVSKPMVYNHFGSKEALYFAYIEDSGRDLVASIVDAERGARGESAERRLAAGTWAFFHFVDEHRDGFVVLYSEMAARGGPARREVSAIRRQIIELVMLLFDRVTEESGVDPESVGGTEALAQAYVGAGESLANWFLEHPDDSVEAVGSRLMNTAWNGLGHVLGGRASEITTDG
jgi:AcrR family transcriptional regulator